MSAATRFFYDLTPNRVLDAVEASGLKCTGRCASLNSFENRVYDVELETEEAPGPKHLPVNRRIVKFYRPGRWSRDQILEEHQFLADLQKAEIPAVAPLPFPDGETLRTTSTDSIFYAIFPKVGGRAPDELDIDQLKRVGRLLARIHNVGASREAPHRIKLDPLTYGMANLDYLLSANWIPAELRSRYQSAVERICAIVEPWLESTPAHRIHGDCHMGNLLWNDSGFFFVDFDDMVRGPAVQDFWLLLGGVPSKDRLAMRQLDLLLEGYEEMRDFDRSTLKLIEPLRALRYVHYSAWVARRWEDPAFPLAFPGFGSFSYWNEKTQDLEEQLGLIQALAH